MEKLLQHPRLGAVVLRRSLRARRITLTVRPSGEVRLTYPMGVSEQRALCFLEEKQAWVERARQRLMERRMATPAPKEVDVEALRRAAKADLPLRMERLAAQTGLRYTKLTIRATRTKWGSCSARNAISLSLYLMTLPEHLRDFVVLHELCHTVHHNHSERFHRLLDSLVGGREKELNRELRCYAIR
ncbi:MAG: DUF45 domain-containing protein [Alistipes sp.]|nr:DUF45 domain-containing protein [Alistipes sp.]